MVSSVACVQMVPHAQIVLLDIISTVARHVLVSDQELLLICQSSLLLTKLYIISLKMHRFTVAKPLLFKLADTSL